MHRVAMWSFGESGYGPFFFVGHGNCRPSAIESIVSVEWVSGAVLVVSTMIPDFQIALLLLRIGSIDFMLTIEKVG